MAVNLPTAFCGAMWGRVSMMTTWQILSPALKQRGFGGRRPDEK